MLGPPPYRHINCKDMFTCLDLFTCLDQFCAMFGDACRALESEGSHAKGLSRWFKNPTRPEGSMLIVCQVTPPNEGWQGQTSLRLLARRRGSLFFESGLKKVGHTFHGRVFPRCKESHYQPHVKSRGLRAPLLWLDKRTYWVGPSPLFTK